MKPGAQLWVDTYHDKVRETIVHRLDDKRQESLHEMLAAALEDWEDAPERVAAIIARHKAAAGQNIEAARYLVQAAQLANQQLASARATALYEEALALLPEATDDRDVEILCCRVCTGLAEGMRIVDRNDEALTLLDRAQAIATRHELVEDLAAIHYMRGNLLFPRGDIQGCLAQHELALAYSQRAGTARSEARALSGLGDAYYMRGAIISAHAHFDRCIQVCRAHSYTGFEVANLSMRGLTKFYQNDLTTALEDGTAAATIAAEIGNERAEILARVGAVSCALVEMNRLDRARDEAGRALDMARLHGTRRFEGNALLVLARLTALAGDRKTASELIEQSLAICRETGFAFVGPQALGAQARITEDPAVRERAFDEALRLLPKGCPSHNHLYFYRDAMEAALTVGDFDTVDRFATALEEYTRAEPLPWSSFFVARGRALCAHARGERSDEQAKALRDLLAESRRVGLEEASLSLARAVAEYGPNQRP